MVSFVLASRSLVVSVLVVGVADDVVSSVVRWGPYVFWTTGSTQYTRAPGVIFLG